MNAWMATGLVIWAGLGMWMVWVLHLRLKAWSAEQGLEEHVNQAMELARARHPASRSLCPHCQAPIVGPAAEHLCSAGPRTEA